MSKYTVYLDGVPIGCDSQEDAIALAKMIASDKSKSTKKGMGISLQLATTARTTKLPSRRPGAAKRMLMALQAVKEADPASGISGRDLASKIGMDSGKGLGPVAQNIKKAVRAEGLAPDSAFSIQRIGTERRWLAGSHIDKAIEILEKEANTED